MLASQILERPVISERATHGAERHHTVTFRVALRATKHQIRAAIQAAYGIRVGAVRTAIVRGKVKRRGQSIGERPNWKKATVQLAPGDNIDFYAAE